MHINRSELNILGLNTLRVSGRNGQYQPDKSYTPMYRGGKGSVSTFSSSESGSGSG